MQKSVYQMTNYFVQPQYISELDYFEIFAIYQDNRTYLSTIETDETDVSRLLV